MSFGGVEGFAPPPQQSPELEHWFAQISAQLTDAYNTLANTDTNTLADLLDTTLTTPTTGQYLRFGATTWEDSDLLWSDLTGTPTTISGYGITDLETSVEALSADITGNWTFSGTLAFSGIASQGTVEGGVLFIDSVNAVRFITAPGTDGTQRFLAYESDAGGFSWQTIPGGGLTNAYASLTDGTTTANASGGDTFKFRSANNAITLAVQDNDATHGDNLLLTFNEGNISITESQISDLGNYLTIPTLTQYGMIYAATTSSITSTAAPSAGSIAFSPDALSWNVTGASAADQVLISTGPGTVLWGQISSAYTTGTFSPSAHAYTLHTGTIPLSHITTGAGGTFLGMTGTTVEWQSIVAADVDFTGWTGATSITTLGTIGTGVWQGTRIDAAYLDLNTTFDNVAETISSTWTFQANLIAEGQIYSGSVNFTDVTGGTFTFNVNNSFLQVIKLGSNTTVTLSNFQLGGIYQLWVWGDEASAYTLQINGVGTWVGGSYASATSVAADTLTIITFSVGRNQANGANRILAIIGADAEPTTV